MSSKPAIIIMPGDGVGRVIVPEAVRVLDAVGFEANYIHADIGWDCWVNEGNSLPQRTVDLLHKHKIALFGAATTAPRDVAAAALSPKLQGKGYVYYNTLMAMRQEFDLDISIRPCRTFPGNPRNFVRKTIDGGYEEPLINTVTFRQNTEDLYFGVEWTNPPAEVRDALNTHPRMQSIAHIPGEELAIGLRVITQKACQRIISAAFDYAKKSGCKSVTVAEKPGGLPETSGMIVREARKIARDYPDINLRVMNIDALVGGVTNNPEDYRVIIAGNLFGDIASDAFAGLVGGPGFAPGANTGREVAIFEPTHGSAPDIADFKLPIVNSIATILAAGMMLEYIGEVEKANRITSAIQKVVAEGKVRTFDMLRLVGERNVIDRGAATTFQLTDAIISKL